MLKLLYFWDLGLGLFLRIETFTGITLSGCVALIPGWFWDSVVIPIYNHPSSTPSLSLKLNITKKNSSFYLFYTKLIQMASFRPCEIQYIQKSEFTVQLELGTESYIDDQAMLSFVKISPFFKHFLKTLFEHGKKLEKRQTYLSLPDPINFESSLSMELKIYYKEIPLMICDIIVQGIKFTWCLVWIYLIISWNLGNIGMPEYATPEQFRPMILSWMLDQNFGGIT